MHRLTWSLPSLTKSLVTKRVVSRPQVPASPCASSSWHPARFWRAHVSQKYHTKQGQAWSLTECWPQGSKGALNDSSLVLCWWPLRQVCLNIRDRRVSNSRSHQRDSSLAHLYYLHLSIIIYLLSSNLSSWSTPDPSRSHLDLLAHHALIHGTMVFRKEIMIPYIIYIYNQYINPVIKCN